MTVKRIKCVLLRSTLTNLINRGKPAPWEENPADNLLFPFEKYAINTMPESLNVQELLQLLPIRGTQFFLGIAHNLL